MRGATWIYRLLLKAMQYVRRLRRGVLRLLRPNLGGVFSKILGYVNFFRLIPLVAAMVLVPRHFFRNLRAIVSGRNPFYPTPTAVATTFAALVLVLAGLVHVSRSCWWIGGLVGTIALLGPVWAIVCAFMVRKVNGGRFSRLSDGWEALLLSGDAYKRLDKRLYLQGLVYLNVYYLAVMPLVLSVVIARTGIPALAGLLPSDMDHELQKKIADFLTYLAAAIAAWIASWTIVRPSGILFVSCVDVPGLKFYEVGFGRLRHRIEDAFYAKPRRREELLEQLRREWRYMVAELRKQELRASVRCPERIAEMLRDRSSAASEIIGLRALLDDDRDAALLEAYHRISDGKPVCARKAVYPSLRASKDACF